MASPANDRENRYISDLRRFGLGQSLALGLRRVIVPLGLSVVFLAAVGLSVAGYQSTVGADWLIVAVAAVVGGYMALNIGANDVANNMGPAVGGKVLTVMAAVVIAAVCEAAGALLAGGEVVATISKGIISPGPEVSVAAFRDLMLSALFAAALWINLATILNAPVSTTHSIVGGVLGAGIAVAGVGLVNWPTMTAIAASWVVSPLLGAGFAAAILYFIKVKILYAEDRLLAAEKWVPLLIALMAGAFMAYMALKGMNKLWRPGGLQVAVFSGLAFAAAYVAARPYVRARVRRLENRRADVNQLFNLPLIAGAALLSFAHGANDVANAVGPLAAIVSTVQQPGAIAGEVTIPLWVMAVGAFGIALGLGLFGPKLIAVVGERITRLNPPRAYAVAFSAAVTVLIATSLGLPVSST
ncbi:MAG TPA: inorganic phosphate transporter, partial [Kiloniellaceae bacterium]|nr:inorganic phosphate transporter [Kiloniellaceae bacterium]